MPEIIKIEIPDNIAEYLEPIPGEVPVGIDAANDPEYFKLSMEIPKAVPDYKKWIELSTLILKEKSKDIRSAAYLVFASYRTEGIKGLNQGLGVLLHLIKRFGSALFPVNPAHKVKALQFLSGSRVTKFIEKERVDKNTLTDLADTKKLLDDLTTECKTLLPGNEQIFKTLSEAVTELIQSSQLLITPPQTEEKKEITSQAINKEPVQQPVTVKPEPEKKPLTQPVQSSAPVLTTEKDITAQLRKSISLMFEYEEEGQKKQRVPEFYQVFGISRIIQWSNLVRPVDNLGITMIEAPNKVIQGLIKDWFTKNNTELLIARVESEFIKENSEFRYWLDAHRYVVLSLESKGGNYKTAADEIKNQLSLLLTRMNDLPQLKFKDKQTSFADPDTIKWINEEVSGRTGSASNNQNGSAMMLVDDKYSDINEEYEKILTEPSENFEKNLMKLQNDMNNDERKKGKFLRRLNIADYCYRHNEYNLARVMSLELKEIINELNLSKWEPALCVTLWLLHYKINKEIVSHNKDETLNKKLSAEQEELFYKIAKYDGILALKLTNQKR